MNRIRGNHFLFLAAVMAMMAAFLLSEYGRGSAAAQVQGLDVTYTTDADFDLGTLVSVNHDPPFNDQLQLDSPTEPFPFINVAASGRGTVVRSQTETGAIVGEYRTAPEGYGLNPSRTTVDLFGNVWTANRNEVGEIDGVPHGSAVKIGLIVGGARVDAAGSPDPNGEYLAPPFAYNTCIDRDGDGLIRTSRGLGDVLDWPDISDGLGGVDGLVQDAADECILIYQRLYDAEQARHVSVDAGNNVWVGGYPFDLRMFYKLDGGTGAILDFFDARDIGCGGYGGLVDGNGILWSVGGPLLRYDPAAGTGFCIDQYGYGLGVDANGFIWMSFWDGGIVKLAPDGTVVPGFPKPIYPTSSSTTTMPSATSAQRQPAPQLPSTVAPVGPAQANGDTHTFQVAPVDDWLSSTSPWTPGANISLTIEDGSGVVYSAFQTADGTGQFNFDLWDIFDLQRGHVVTVSDGTTIKSHTVIDLYVDGVDLDADTVFGLAGPGSDVNIWVHGDGGLTVTADGSGNWTADFSGMTDLTYLSDGGSQQFDDDGDSTGVWWAPKRIQTAPEDDWIQSDSPWTPGATISLTIEDSSGVIYADSQTADSDGRFNFELWNVFDLQRGHVVTVSDGTTFKTHTITNLFVDGVDVTADTVFGRAGPGSDVNIWVHGDGGLTVTADGAGNWVADFSSMTDLTYFSDGGSRQVDDDGDTTNVWWYSPSIEVAPVDNWVQSWNRWTPGSTISLTIEDSSGVIYSDSQTADIHGNFHFGLDENVIDLRRGHVVTVSDGNAFKNHTVTNLYVDGVDVTADTVFGRAAAGSSVKVWVHGDGDLEVTADGSGNWTADFSGMTDLTYSSDGGSRQVDSDGDSTGVWWSSPNFTTAPDDDWVQAWGGWAPGATISLTIEDGGRVIYTDLQTSDADGRFNFRLWDVFDLQRGHVVTVSDGTTTKTHTVTNLFVDGVDVTADTVFGRADPGTSVDIWVHGDGSMTVTADIAGNWVADFSGMTDLTYASDGGSQQLDDDRDATGVWWASPSFQVAPDDDWVQSWNRWTPNSIISLVIEDGSGVIYSDSQTADDQGNFNFEFGGTFDLQRGHVVTVSDGNSTKTHTVFDLYVDGVDPVADTVFGRTLPGADVSVWVHGDGDTTATADAAGNWVADFSGLTDLTPFSDGGSSQSDDDGDSTGVWWATPRIQAGPQDNSINSRGRWTPGATISLTIEDGSGVLYADSQTANRYGDFNFSLGWFDLLTGHVVTISDGTATKTHTVTDIDVLDIDAASDVVSGTAYPGATVQVWASLFDDGVSRMVIADFAGNWVADFSVPSADQPDIYDITEFTRIEVEEYDDDGDSTYRRFGPPVQQNRGVAVTPIDNHVWVANSGVQTVTRLDNDGNVIKVIETGDVPTGVAVDAAGKVWATNLGSDNTVRIDPNAGPDGLGAVDLTVDLGPGANPYNYSDMTGAVVVGSTSPQGFWTVIQDSQRPGLEWGRITWNHEPEGNVPPGTEIVVEARAADTEAGLGGQPFVQVDDDVLFSLFGRYIEVRATLKASPSGASPVLSDMRIRPALLLVDIDVKPGSDPNSINCLNKKETITVAILTTGDFDALSVDHTSVLFQGAAEFHRTRGQTARHEEDVDLDGDMDLVFHFRLEDTDLNCDSVEAVLIGATYDGFDIEGLDAVGMIGRKSCLAPPAGLVSRWPADGNADDIADHNHGTLQGDATYATGMVGQAFSFDGEGDYVKIPRAPNLDVGAELTIELWLKADPSNLMQSCCQGLVTTDFYEFAIAPGAGSVTGVMLMTAADGWVHSSDQGEGGFPLTPGAWYHVAGVYDGANVLQYVNGELVVDPPAQTGNIWPMLQTSFLAIGSEDGRTNEPGLIGQRYFHGLIDEVGLYNQALSASEIQAIYEAGSAGMCKDG